MYNRCLLAAGVCCLLIFLVLAGACAPAPAKPGKSLTIGVAATYTGGLSATGRNVCDGNLDYLRWIASRGGIEYTDPTTGQTESVAINVIWEDTQYDVAKATSAYKRMKAAGVNAILGFGSTPGEACAASASRDKIPYLSWYAYASPAGYAPKPQYYWTCLPVISDSLTPLPKWFIQEKWQGAGVPRIGYLVMDVPSWRPVAKPGITDAYIRSLGGEFVGVEFVPPLTTDISVQLSRLVFEKEADCIVLTSGLEQSVVLIKDIRRLGIDPGKVTIVLNPSAWDESLLKFPEIEGLYGQIMTALPGEDVPGMDLVNQVREWAGRSPETFQVNYIAGFVGSMVMETAVRRALENVGYEGVIASGQPIRDELAMLKPMTTGGLTPELAVRYPDYPFYFLDSKITQAKGGKFEVVSDWISLDLIPGAME